MIDRSKFREIPRPYVAAIVQERSIEASVANIMNSEHDGAAGFMVDLSYLKPTDRSAESMNRLFGSTKKPIMPLLYKSGYMADASYTDEDRANEMLRLTENGIVSFDVPGYLFEKDAKRELAQSEKAVEKQKELIGQLHEKGAEVLISSHMAEVLSGEEVLAHLREQQRRGADIAKIITLCNTEEQLLESIRTLILLKREMEIPYIFLCNGALGRLQRWYAPVLGSMLTFGVNRYNEISQGVQPTVSAAREILREMLI